MINRTEMLIYVSVCYKSLIVTALEIVTAGQTIKTSFPTKFVKYVDRMSHIPKHFT